MNYVIHFPLALLTLFSTVSSLLYYSNPTLLTSLRLSNEPHLFTWRQAKIERFLDRNDWIGDFLANLIRNDLPQKVKDMGKEQFLQSMCPANPDPNMCIRDIQDVLCSATKLYGLSQETQSCFLKNSTQECYACENDLNKQKSALVWTAKVFDSLGKPSPGIEFGDTRWTGSFDQCLKLQQTKQFHYCTGKFGLPMSSVEAALLNKTTLCLPVSETKFVEVGICVPDSCSSTFLTGAFNKAVAGQEPETLCHSEVTCFSEDPVAKDGGSVFMILLSSFFILFLVIGTMFDFVVFQPMTKYFPSKEDLQKNGISLSNGDAGTSDLSMPPHETGFKMHPDPKTKEEYFSEFAWYFKALMAFSAYSNGKRLMNTNLKKDRIPCLYGIRFLSMSWILYAHIYFFSLDYIANAAQVLQFPTSFLFQIINNASVAVDTFFVLSGFLLAYSWLKKVAKTNGADLQSARFWVKFYLHRILRILPVYMIILGLGASVWPHFGMGPLWEGHNDPNIKNCPKYFWTNMLFLNNFIKSNDMCFGWTWYLANDMQFFLFSPAVLVLFWLYPVLGSILCATLIIISAVTVALVTASNGFPPTFMLTNNPKDWINLTDFAQEVFFMPYARWPAYVVGLYFGYLLWKHRASSKIGSKLCTCLLLISFLLSFAIVFGVHSYAQGYGIFSTVSALYASIHRPLWAISVSIVILVCINGDAGYIGEVLSWSLWIPLSRLTFCVYLIHPLVILSYYATLSYPEHITHYGMMFHFISGNMISYGIAFALHILFEAPLCRLEGIFVEKGGFSTGTSGMEPLYQRFGEIRSSLQETFLGRKHHPKPLSQVDQLVAGDKFEQDEPFAGRVGDRGVDMDVMSNQENQHQINNTHQAQTIV